MTRATDVSAPASNGSSDQTAFFTVPGLAKRWQISERTVLRLLAAKALPCLRIGRSVRISVEDVVAYEKKNWK
jgi:excisionase family DNA binding protein